MAVELTGTNRTFVGTGSPANYTPLFYARSADQVDVYVDGGLKVIGDDYTLTGLGAPGGVGVLANFPLNSVVYVERITSITQEVDTQNNETILEDVLDEEFDKLTMIAQEQQTQLARTVSVPKGENGFTLPALASRSNHLPVFAADGDLEVLAGSNIVVILDANGKPAGTAVFDILRSIGTTIYDDGAWGGSFTDDGIWG